MITCLYWDKNLIVMQSKKKVMEIRVTTAENLHGEWARYNNNKVNFVNKT